MLSSPETGALAEALAKCQGQLRDVPKAEQANAGRRGSYRYFTLADMLEQVRPILSAAGLAVVQDADLEETLAVVRTRLLHTSGEWLETTCRVPAVALDGSHQGSLTAQSVGSAITYGRRYGLSALLGVTGTDDDDGAAASPKREPASAPVRPPVPAKAVQDALRGSGGVMPIVPQPAPSKWAEKGIDVNAPLGEAPPDRPTPETVLTAASPWMTRGGKLMDGWIGQTIGQCAGWQGYVYHLAAEKRTKAQIQAENPTWFAWAILAARLRAARKSENKGLVAEVELAIQDLDFYSDGLGEQLLAEVLANLGKSGAQWRELPAEFLASVLEGLETAKGARLESESVA